MIPIFRRFADIGGCPPLRGEAWRRLIAVFAASIALSLAVIPQAASAPFGDHGTAIPPIYIPGGSAVPAANLQQADGKVIVVGTADGPVASTMFAARFSATGVIDPTYGTGGIVYIDIPPDLPSLSAGAATLDASGNLILVGQGVVLFPSYLGPQIVVVRLLPSGLLDPAFGNAGVARPSIPGFSLGTSATAVAIDSQGRIVVGGGAVDSLAGNGGFLVLRLLPTGMLDTAFNATGYRVLNLSQYTSAASSLALTSADGVVVAGNDNPFTNGPFAVARLTSGGALDSAFGGTGVVFMGGGRYIGVDVADKVLVATQGGPFPQDTIAVTRLNAAGAVDASYGVGGTAQVSLSGQLFGAGLGGLRIDSAGRTVLAARGLDAMGNAFFALRLTTIGTLDAGFGTAGVQSVSAALPFVDAVVLGVGLGDSVFLSGGSMNSLVAHLTAAGVLDMNFNGTGLLTALFGTQPLTLTGMVRQPDGKLVLVGFGEASFLTPTSNFVVARLTLAGALDPSFNGTGFRIIETGDGSSHFNAIALDGAGRIVLASHDYVNNFHVVRLLPGGTFDSAFNGTGSVTVADLPVGYYQREQGLAVDSQARILLVGGGVTRLTVSGALDPSFGTGGKAPLPVQSTEYQRLPITVDGSDRPLVGGALSDGTILTFAVARLTTSGLLDATFGNSGISIISLGAGMMSANVSALAVDAGGKIVVAGPATTNVAALGSVARVTGAGTLDPTFNVTGISTFPGSFRFPSAIAFDPLGRIVVTGEGYTSRLNFNGSVDSTFNAAQLLATSILPGSSPLQSQAVVADASGVYLGGTGGHAFAVVRLFDGMPTKLAMFPAITGAQLVAATPFDLIVQAQDAAGNPQPAAVATSVALSLVPGGSLLGTTTCTIPAGQTFCTVAGAAFPVSGYIQLQAVVTGGDSLAPVVWQSLYVDRANVTVAIVSDTPDPSNFGQAITITASISAAPAIVVPTGSVSVTIDGGSGCFITLPATSCTFTPNSAGTKTLVASFYGDATFNRADSPPVTHVVTPSSIPPLLLSVVSRKAHGSAGVFDVPLTGSALVPAIEPRVGPAQTIVFNFDKQIIASTATVAEGTATMAGRFNSGGQVIVSLTGVTDRQYVTISLTNIGAVDGSTGSATMRVGFLAGDINRSRSVSLADLGLVNAQLAKPVTAANFLIDVNASGTVSLADKGITNANLTKALPAP